MRGGGADRGGGGQGGGQAAGVGRRGARPPAGRRERRGRKKPPPPPKPAAPPAGGVATGAAAAPAAGRGVGGRGPRVRRVDGSPRREIHGAEAYARRWWSWRRTSSSSTGCATTACGSSTRTTEKGLPCDPLARREQRLLGVTWKDERGRHRRRDQDSRGEGADTPNTVSQGTASDLISEMVGKLRNPSSAGGGVDHRRDQPARQADDRAVGPARLHPFRRDDELRAYDLHQLLSEQRSLAKSVGAGRCTWAAPAAPRRRSACPTRGCILNTT